MFKTKYSFAIAIYLIIFKNVLNIFKNFYNSFKIPKINYVQNKFLEVRNILINF